MTGLRLLIRACDIRLLCTFAALVFLLQRVPVQILATGSCTAPPTVDQTMLLTSGTCQSVSVGSPLADQSSCTVGCIHGYETNLLDPVKGPMVVDGDDNIQDTTLAFAFPFLGHSYTTISVSTNGFISFGGGDSDDGCCNGNVANMLANQPRIAAFWFDLVGPVYVKTDATITVIFWDSVTFTGELPVQIQLWLKPDGTFSYLYKVAPTLAESHDMVTGFSAGNNDADPGSTAILSLTTPFTVASTVTTFYEYFSGTGSGGNGLFNLAHNRLTYTPNAGGYILNIDLAVSDSNTFTCNGGSWVADFTCILASGTCTTPASSTSVMDTTVATGGLSSCSSLGTYTPLVFNEECSVACISPAVLAGTATYTCQSGYLVNGPSCNRPCTSPPSFGTFEDFTVGTCQSVSGTSATAHGDTCTAGCIHAYQSALSDPTVNTYTCNDGSWTSNSACTIKTGACTTPLTASGYVDPTVVSGTYPACGSLSTTHAIEAGEKCSFGCTDSDVAPTPSNLITCTAGALATGPTCVATPCTSPPVVDQTSQRSLIDMTVGSCKDVSSTNQLAHGSTCSYGCVTGYYSTYGAKCVKGKYSPPPFCVGYPLPGNIFLFGTKV